MWIKICGIRDVETARRVSALRPDAIGMVFYDRSPRAIDAAQASQIVSILPTSVEPIGLFVNHSLDAIREICHECGLQAVQLHGDESPLFVSQLTAELPEVRIIRAHRLRDHSLQALDAYLASTRELGGRVDAVLLDAWIEGTFGGTGQPVDWDVVARDYRVDAWPPLILAGGLHPENVADAIRIVRPYGVDVSSGVESARGVKSIERVGDFLTAARGAFRELRNQSL